MPKKSNQKRADGRIAVQVFLGTVDGKRRLLESYLYDMNLEYGAFTAPQKKFAPQKVPFVIRPFTLHCLRHTFCSMMYNAGVDVLTAQQQMGHSDVKTTLEIYTHLSQEKKAADISKLNSSLEKMQVKCKSNASQMQVRDFVTR